MVFFQKSKGRDVSLIEYDMNLEQGMYLIVSFIATKMEDRRFN